MEEQKKPFSQELYDKYDSKAKIELSIFIEQQGYVMTSSPFVESYSNYDIEAVSTTGEAYNYHLFEVEVKSFWKKRGEWQDMSRYIRVPHRKAILQATDHVMFNYDYTTLALTKMDDIRKCPIAEAPNKYVKEGELFFHIPPNLPTYYTKEENLWLQVRKLVHILS